MSNDPARFTAGPFLRLPHHVTQRPQDGPVLLAQPLDYIPYLRRSVTVEAADGRFQPGLADILHEIRAIQRKLDQGIIQYPGGELDSEQGEPETAARNLDALDEILGEL